MLKLRFKKRLEPLTWTSGLIMLAGVLLSLGLSALLLYLQGKSPVEGISLLFKGAFGSRWALEDSLSKSIPIFLCSLGVAIAFRLQIWNIGAEGQYAMGALGATWVALNFPGLPWFIQLPSMLTAAFICGGLWGLIPALLKLKLKANEIIITLMFNYMAISFMQYLIYGSWKDPKSFGFPMTAEFAEGGIIPTIGETGINQGIFFCLICGLLLWVFLKYSRIGFELMASGENIRTARYAKLPYKRLVTMSMLFSGALAGSAGFIEASATLNRLEPNIISGYGYTAIVVAWLAQLNPFYIAVSSFLLAGLRVGVENLQLEMQVPAAFGGIMEGLILMTVLAGSFFIRYTIQLEKK